MSLCREAVELCGLYSALPTHVQHHLSDAVAAAMMQEAMLPIPGGDATVRAEQQQLEAFAFETGRGIHVGWENFGYQFQT